MTGEGFGAGDGRAGGVEDAGESECFGGVACGGAGAVGVDVIDVGGGGLGVGEGEVDGVGEADSLRVRGGGVVAVGGLAPTGEAGEGSDVASAGGGGGFKDEDGGASGGGES